jgi:serine protease Do
MRKIFNKKFALVLGGAALLALSLAALPGRSQSSSGSNQQDGWYSGKSEAELRAQMARLEAQLEALHSRLQVGQFAPRALLEQDLAGQKLRLNADQLAQQAELYAELMAQQAATTPLVVSDDRDFWFSTDGESGWLGVSIEEVSADKAKELKLSPVHGALITEVEADSPAAKAGLKVNDIVTDYNGQRVEGTAEFRRLIRETPSGRTVQLTVWRDGRSQTISTTLADMGDQIRRRIDVISPKIFSYTLPKMGGGVFTMATRGPILGIGVQDVEGQLGKYFGAPDGEGVLVTEVNSGSPAEKGGMKAGDVIIKLDGNRVRTTGELRDQLRESREKKTVSITVLRKGAESSLNVEIEQPKPPAAKRKTIAYRSI